MFLTIKVNDMWANCTFDVRCELLCGFHVLLTIFFLCINSFCNWRDQFHKQVFNFFIDSFLHDFISYSCTSSEHFMFNVNYHVHFMYCGEIYGLFVMLNITLLL